MNNRIIFTYALALFAVITLSVTFTCLGFFDSVMCVFATGLLFLAMLL